MLSDAFAWTSIMLGEYYAGYKSREDQRKKLEHFKNLDIFEQAFTVMHSWEQAFEVDQILILFLPAFGPLNRGWYVQYGWSGNGGYFRVVGLRLLVWYKAPEDVEYLFRLGQTSFIGKRKRKRRVRLDGNT